MITLPRSDVEKQEILSAMAAKFELGKTYKGSEVAKVLQDSDVDDYTLFRRELVNFGYFDRNPYLEEYVLKKKELSQEELEKVGLRYQDIKKELGKD
ncbi:MAG: hypothetical protein ACI83O_000893 [Patescibacteria group bacterium]|jgi:hypothetical protein